MQTILRSSMMDVRSQKKALRKQVEGALRAMTPGAIVAQSNALAQHIIALDAIRTAQCVCVYLSMEHEARTAPILTQLFAAGKKVYVPKVTGMRSEDMVMLQVDSENEMASFPKSKWGIPEPPELLPNGTPRINALDALDIDVVLVPGVAFDAHRNRLGHGKGYYDCFFQRYALRNGGELPATIGLALDVQMVPAVPTSDHDKVLDMVATPTGVLQ
ncbi:5-formyltetrahydrofolate cyclo-ligase [Achlya hypogyna]|uniref:5-formyltetrahydrofolate cyclo-ligase n=1 Tax=Achlya hypogyna TaxID=1202772 RepID=A0A1V9ZFD4_ACHHY|nr:5-formyltetrahydrofolate cyclo-ligase [Achlya hypogyna]